jgi:hypothetical protein
MREIYQVLQQKEADVAHVRKEIEGLQVVLALLSNELSLKDAYEVLQQKEACLARVRKEIESLQIVAPLLSDETPFGGMTRMPTSSVEETLDRDHGSEATGTDGLFSSLSTSPRSKFWKILKRKT